MAKKELEMTLPKISLDDLFTTQEQRDYNNAEKVEDIKICNIDNFKNHPFKVLKNEELEQLVESIKEKGVISPVLVRPKENGRYEMVSGHRRMLASQYANLDTIPCIIRNLTDDEATILMVDSNLQREKLLPSEKAFAYKMKIEALKHQGKRNDLTCGQDGHKLENIKSRDILANEVSDSARQIQRYIRLTYLIPELLEKVDVEKIAFSPAVEISYLTKEEQLMLLDFIDYNDIYPSVKQAKDLKELSNKGELDSDSLEELMMITKPNQVRKIAFDEGRIRKVLPKEIKREEIEDFVVKSIEFYQKYHNRKKEQGAR